jgi:hypothetical protein
MERIERYPRGDLLELGNLANEKALSITTALFD